MVKSLEDKLSHAVEEGDSQALYLAGQDIDHEASERYRGYVVRSWLKRVPNEAINCNMFAREEEVPFRYIDSVKSPDRHVLRSICEMHEAFRVHFRDRFTCDPKKFRSFAAI